MLQTNLVGKQVSYSIAGTEFRGNVVAVFLFKDQYIKLLISLYSPDTDLILIEKFATECKVL